ncbi:MAG: L-2-amino-thiazoline-4-carboxylic acid hydrolase [Anaerolineales bacterium]
MIACLPGSQEVIEDNGDCFALHVYRCFILDSLRAHNATELTVLFCKTDDWLAAALPKVRFERTKMLSQGYDHCDFRWCRIR